MGLFGGGGWWWNDPLAVHFVHRSLAYLLALALAVWWWRARGTLGLRRHAVLGLVFGQVALGALTVVQSIRPGQLLWFGVAHQLAGLALMVALVAALRSLWSHGWPVQASSGASSAPAEPGAARA